MFLGDLGQLSQNYSNIMYNECKLLRKFETTVSYLYV